jgi:acyl-coenzyme A synthetase/AMP-(fatty) acid ligase
VSAQHALITSHTPDDVLAWRPSGPVPVRQFLADAHALAAWLPQAQAVFNLCEDRYHFAVLFAACAMRRQISLQPPSYAPEVIQRIAQQYGPCVAVVDAAWQASGSVTWSPESVNTLVFPELASLARPAEPADMPMLDSDQTVAVLFTSGSTGQPQPHAKTWGKLVLNGQAEAHALGLHEQPAALVGTVAVQHSYGFESTFLLALHGGCSFWSGKPLYPPDVLQALAAVPEPRMLVTTPHHLRALMASGLAWPSLDICLCATAPLGVELAQQVEQHAGAPVHEIYGSTESGQLATRRTTEGAGWQLLRDVALRHSGDDTLARGGHVEGEVRLSDIIELQGEHRFLLHGRQADLINIAGKRSSLAYLDHQLRTVAGVQDGAFFLPDEPVHAGADVTRLTAFVVAPRLAAASVQAVLRQLLDPVFLPRPLVFVDALPRDGNGKVLRSALVALYQAKVRRATS